jgi:TolA-binding protein
MKRALGALLVLVLPLAGQAQDRSKKAYELMYEDVQALKQQVLRIEKRFDQAADDLRSLGALVRDLVSSFKEFQTAQVRAQDGLKDVPIQVRALQEQLSQIEGQILKLAADVQALKARPEPAVEPPAGEATPDEKAPSAKKSATKVPVKKGEAPAETPPPPGLSPQEAYQTSYADYEKGNYDLAADGFAIFREQFGSDAVKNPLADNALYMIGECRYSQKKYAQAVEALDDLILTYSLSDKIAAAYLKKGYALAEMKRKDEAVAVLKVLVSKFPLVEEARNAQQKIKELQESK